MEKTNSGYITVDELRNRLSVSRNMAYRIANSGSLETIKIGRSLRVSEDSLTRWLDTLKHQKVQGGDDMK
jgi:excisionase family DNA binding protein